MEPVDATEVAARIEQAAQDMAHAFGLAPDYCLELIERALRPDWPVDPRLYELYDRAMSDGDSGPG
jgi:hypothetical protein